MPLTVTPTFRELLADFGGERPMMTKLVLSAWFPIGIGLIPAALLAAVPALASDTTFGRRRACIVGSALLAFIGVAVCLFAYYGPIFALAGAVAAE